MPTKKRRNKLGISADRRPRPDISKTKLTLLFERHVLLLGVAERPDFIALDSLARQVTKMRILVLRTSGSHFCQQSENGALSYSSHSDCGADRAPFYQGRDHCNFLVHAQRVHETSILYRFSMSRKKSSDSLFFLGPACLCSLYRYLSAALACQRCKASFASNETASPAHFRHYLRYQTGIGCCLRRGFDYASSVLDNIKLWCAYAFLHDFECGTRMRLSQPCGISN